MVKKKCTKCGDPKPLDQFNIDAGHRDGHRSECQACERTRRKTYRSKNKKQLAKQHKTWRERSKKHLAAWQREYYKRPGTYRGQRNSQLQRKYGITIEQYERMNKTQRGRCGVCGKRETAVAPNGKPRGLSVDHCHSTKIVRGLVCSRCNCALGMVDDDPAILQNLIAYLRKNVAA